MKHKRHIFFLAILSVTLIGYAANPYQSVTNVSLPNVIVTNKLTGEFYMGYTGYYCTLTLKPDSTYFYEHRACAGLIGTTSGKWCVETNTLHVIPEVKTGLYLTDARYSLPPLDILAYRDEYVFVHPKWRSSFIDYGKEGKVLRAFCFMKQPEDSNTAPLPATARPKHSVVGGR